MKKIFNFCFFIFFTMTVTSMAAQENKTAQEEKNTDEAKSTDEVKSNAGKKFDPKICYKRCMDEVDDKATCDYVCYKRKKD